MERLDHKGSFRLRHFIRAAVLAAGLLAASAFAAPTRLAIIDNDFAGAGGGLAIVPLVTQPDMKLLGATVSIGDGYVNDSVAHTLRFLEIAHHPEIPVVPGANVPLVRTKAELNIWEKQYGTMPYKGAWDDPKPGGQAFGPDDITPMKEGETRLKPTPGPAALWLIEQTRAHPGQIEILAAGPLTNLALAVRLDPDFAKRVKTLVIMGGLVDANQLQVTANADFNTDFNFMFDPEAADIVLTAGFPKVLIIGNVSNAAILTQAIVDKVGAVKTPVTDYYIRNAWVGLPLWDEMAAAVMADPSLIAKKTETWMRVNLDHGVDYGRAHVWPEEMRPHLGEQPVTIVDAIDLDRFFAGFVRDLQAPLPK
jgi:inosine-uridine nucleoside N-ribohydrolase